MLEALILAGALSLVLAVAAEGDPC